MSCMMTHSLLSSWLYAMKDNPYEDLTTERDYMDEFMKTLRREQTPTTEAMQNGIDFEDMVTDIVLGKDRSGHKWHSAAARVADIISGGRLQYRASKPMVIDGVELLLYGRLDALKAGEIYDIKFSKNYERGKYINSTQHPVYLELVPEATGFTYIVSNGSEVWTERYRRDETADMGPIISDFLLWLRGRGLLGLYKEKWRLR